MNYKGKLYGGKIRGKHFPLAQTAQDVDDLALALRECIYALESTSSASAILVIKKAKEALRKFELSDDAIPEAVRGDK